MYENLRKSMQNREINAKALAVFLRISPMTMQKKLRGDKEFSIEEAFQIKRYFFPDLALSYLFQKGEKEHTVT